MIKYHRTKNTVRNSFYGIILRFINLIGAFLARTILIRILGMNYIGLDGLFTSILTVLSMAELGFSSAIVFKMYKPIANGDEKTVCALLQFYRKVYNLIGLVVCIIGLGILPFLNVVIGSSVPENINIYILYIIYLLNTCFTYWLFAYKTALINAHQRNDLTSKVSGIVSLTKYLLQISLVLVFRSYYIYVIILPFITIIMNLGNAYIANKYYPQYKCKGSLSREDFFEIKEKILALLYNKIGVAIINGSDNIVISSFLGLKILGIYNSYYYVFTMLHSFFDVFHSAIMAGIGNSIVTESIEYNYKMFKRLCFINSWLVGWSSICLGCMYKPFIEWWIGRGESFSSFFSLVMALLFYFWMIRFIVIVFKSAQGLWYEDRYRALTEGVCNLILNLIMVKVYGIYGVVISTIVSMIFISIPWEIHTLFKYYFKKSSISYYKDFLKNFLLFLCIGIITFYICNFVDFSEIINIITSFIICVTVPNFILIILNRKTDEFKYILSFFKEKLIFNNN